MQSPLLMNVVCAQQFKFARKPVDKFARKPVDKLRNFSKHGLASSERSRDKHRRKKRERRRCVWQLCWRCAWGFYMGSCTVSRETACRPEQAKLDCASLCVLHSTSSIKLCRALCCQWQGALGMSCQGRR